MGQQSRVLNTASFNNDTLVLSIDGKTIQLAHNESTNLFSSSNAAYTLASANYSGNKAEPDADGIIQLCSTGSSTDALYNIVTSESTLVELAFADINQIAGKTFYELDSCVKPSKTGNTSARLSFATGGSATFYDAGSDTAENFSAAEVETFMSTTGSVEGATTTWSRVFKLKLAGTDYYFMLESGTGTDNVYTTLWIEGALIK